MDAGCHLPSFVVFGGAAGVRRRRMFSERTTVGLDVHARSVVAEAVDWQTGQVFSRRLVPDNQELLAWVVTLPGPVAVTYEAGPTGFGLARAFAAAGVRCVVVAPSKLERPPGDRIKTDRRDARRLGRLLHIGEITGIRVPTEAEEDARDLFRSREDARVDLMRARHRLSKLLLRHGIVYSGGNAWNGVHDRWLRSQRFELPGTRAAFDAAYDAVLSTTARRGRLDEAIIVTAAEPAWAPVVSRLGAIRGIATLTGFGLAVEIGDWDRFTGASIGAYLGLVPSESSTGASRNQGSITKTGNTHARRLLVEAAWHHQRLLRPASTAVALRRAKVSPAVRARGLAADHRLHRRWAALATRKKEPSVIAVAVARELAGWCWSLATMDG
jgi:transposase